MSDPEIMNEDIDLDENGEEEEEAPPAAAGRNFKELPEGYLTLVGFSKLLAKKPPVGRFVRVRSQVLYSTAKNTKNFPVETHVDGRQIINIEKGLKWWDDKEARKAERAAAATLPEDE